MDVITMEKSMRDCPENKMKRQWIIVGVICFVAMAFLTVFLMKRYREKTEYIFAELVEESLLSSHSEALTEMERFLNNAENPLGVEEAWEALTKDESDIFHYVCNSEGEILAGDMRIFNIKYTKS